MFTAWKAAKTDSAREIAELKKAICIYCREELGDMNFKNDRDAIEYILSFTEETPQGVSDDI